MRGHEFWNHILKKPSYGYLREGALYIPRSGELWREFFQNINIKKDLRNWAPFWSWMIFLFCLIYFFYYLFFKFDFHYLWILLLYPVVILNIHGTCWLHRYSSHRAFSFSHPIWIFVFKNLVPKIVLEEAFAISHYVHHQIPDSPGDPYNARAGRLYCFLADANHQKIAPNLDERTYRKVSELLKHTGIYRNTYQQYQKWGSVSHPLYTIAETIFSWVLTYGVLNYVGGQDLAQAALAGISTWAFTIRNFNYKSHGKGKDRRRLGVYDRDEKSLAINQFLPGLVAGEWHSNHHLYPNSARNGIRWYELDLSFLVIKMMKRLKIVHHYKNHITFPKKD